jgi:3-oxoadipate enol-lactonase
MHKAEIRPGVWIAYEDDWFGKPWSVPETVVMVHGNSESSRAWFSWVTHLADKYRVVRLDLPGFAPRLSRPGTAGAPANSPPTSLASWMR